MRPRNEYRWVGLYWSYSGMPTERLARFRAILFALGSPTFVDTTGDIITIPVDYREPRCWVTIYAYLNEEVMVWGWYAMGFAMNESTKNLLDRQCIEGGADQ